MSETLYPHEVLVKIWDKNVYGILSAISFIYAGIFLSFLIKNNIDDVFFVFVCFVFFVWTGVIYNNRNLESRSLN